MMTFDDVGCERQKTEQGRQGQGHGYLSDEEKADLDCSHTVVGCAFAEHKVGVRTRV